MVQPHLFKLYSLVQSTTTASYTRCILSNVDGTNDATISVSVSGSAILMIEDFYLKTVEVPADSTVVIEKPINLGAGDKLRNSIKKMMILMYF